jgi:UDP-N-acetylglucosamine 2-epimerase (non-hydrolysing)
VKKVVVVYGTRPEAIKLAPVIVELRKIQYLHTIVICSGQHKEMLEGIMELWNVTPDSTLDYDFESGHSSAIPNLMIKLEREFLRLEPDFVLVQGDTATAAAAAIQAHALHIPIGHVEAGLRSGDLWNPWPEEANRKIIDAISSLHFAPTEASHANLIYEKNDKTSFLTGNTVVDAIHYATLLLDKHPSVRSSIQDLINFSLDEPFILFTQHRREGFGGGQGQVFDAIVQLADLGHKIVFPVHLNPSVRSKVAERLSGKAGIALIEPQGYLPFLELIRSSRLIISDSGGLQEEAPSFGKSILITRLRTERPEVIEAGFGHLVGYEKSAIVELSQSLMNDAANSFINPFGDGKAAIRISTLIKDYLCTNFKA